MPELTGVCHSVSTSGVAVGVEVGAVDEPDELLFDCAALVGWVVGCAVDDAFDVAINWAVIA